MNAWATPACLRNLDKAFRRQKDFRVASIDEGHDCRSEPLRQWLSEYCRLFSTRLDAFDDCASAAAGLIGRGLRTPGTTGIKPGAAIR
jgi:hypothetical protein